MAEHECETYDFPITNGAFNYTFKKTVVKKVGGTGVMAVREAIDEAKDQATKAGEATVKGETCAKPCQRLIYVDVTIGNINSVYTNPKKTKLTITISGTWQTGILCIKKPGSE